MSTTNRYSSDVICMIKEDVIENAFIFLKYAPESSKISISLQELHPYELLISVIPEFSVRWKGHQSWTSIMAITVDSVLLAIKHPLLNTDENKVHIYLGRWIF